MSSAVSAWDVPSSVSRDGISHVNDGCVDLRALCGAVWFDVDVVASVCDASCLKAIAYHHVPLPTALLIIAYMCGHPPCMNTALRGGAPNALVH